MRASLFKDNFREIVKSPNRFISIFLIVALGTAFFAGIKAAAPDMKATADAYYDSHNMMDIRILSTMGLTDGDIEAMRQVEGVKTVQASYFADVVTTIHSSEFVYRIHALPADAILSGSQDYLNKPDIIEGRLPQKSGEFFKSGLAGKTIMSELTGIPIELSETAAEGGAWGIALLADYRNHADQMTLGEYLEADNYV